MPKVYLSQRAKDAEMVRENMLLVQGARTDEEMSMKIGAKSPQTWRSRKKNPEKLTLGEIMRLCEKCHVDYVAFVSKHLQLG